MSNLRKYRKKTKLTQSAFAKLLGWKHTRLCNYEQGIRQPSIEVCHQLVQLLNKNGVDCSFTDVFPPSTARVDGEAA